MHAIKNFCGKFTLIYQSNKSKHYILGTIWIKKLLTLLIFYIIFYNAIPGRMLMALILKYGINNLNCVTKTTYQHHTHHTHITPYSPSSSYVYAIAPSIEHLNAILAHLLSPPHVDMKI